jgi:hypothetical protein
LLTVRGATLQILATCPVVKIVFMAGSPVTCQSVRQRDAGPLENRFYRAARRSLPCGPPGMPARFWVETILELVEDGCRFFASAVCRRKWRFTNQTHDQTQTQSRTEPQTQPASDGCGSVVGQLLLALGWWNEFRPPHPAASPNLKPPDRAAKLHSIHALSRGSRQTTPWWGIAFLAFFSAQNV